MPQQSQSHTPAMVTLPESSAAHLLAHRIVERVDAAESTSRLDVSHVIGQLAAQSAPANLNQLEALSEVISGADSAPKGRVIIGIVGAPGAGKSTVTAEVAEVLTERGISVAVLPMDGFHLSNRQLARLGLSSVKGAPETFDSAGFMATLRRVVAAQEDVFVPVFHREIEESYAADGAVPASAQVVLVEGNYLLLDYSSFAQVRALLTESWFLKPEESTRIDRLVLRHVQHGKAPQDAIDWALGPDQRNAERILAASTRATLVVELV